MSIYIHIPFCTNICSYCDLCKILKNKQWIDKYLIALEKEIKENYKKEKVNKIYIGGGTPSILSLKQLEKLFNILKIFNIDKHKEFFEEYNKDIINKLSACLNFYSLPLEKIHPKNSKGEEKYLGVWDYEGSYDMFKTLGAKRYMMSQGDELKITIAGVNKKTGVEYLKYKYKTMYNIFMHFDNDLVFPATYNDNREEKQGSGKNTLTYLDNEQEGYVTDYLGNTAKYHEYSSIHLESTSYSLSMADIYLSYLKGVKGDYIWKSKNTTLLLT